MSAEFPYGIEAKAEGQSAQVIQIDLGKHLAAMIVMAAISAISATVAVGTVWHSKDREVSTESQLRKTQNHEDELNANVRYLTKLEEQYHAAR